MSSSELFIVSTPIGNLGDMTARAVDVLKQVSVIAAEDTRHSRRLMDHFGVETPMIPCHDHNERQQAERIIDKLKQGESVALVSDAGTPLISDPGFYLVRSVREAGFKVTPIPGACAIISALSVSGLATDRFFFEGFLPAKRAGRRKKLEMLGEMPCTWGVYESTHRIIDSLTDFVAVLGADRSMVLVREITKTFETVIAGTTAEVLTRLKEDSDQCRGEFVLLVEGFQEDPDQSIDAETIKLLARLLEELPPKKAAAIVSDLTGLRKKDLYDQALALKQA
ncbi:16S rRNA (cytidine(1402)-2'-O)-methyltransferase [Endozoicomonas sp. (ex Bugula neritina AB1)]|nr:16S rRNA (cytidine(1402)-2'-O)-methyltransferase [Endozoicomonas sp. (ex Bugula neritina AB1)]